MRSANQKRIRFCCSNPASRRSSESCSCGEGCRCGAPGSKQPYGEEEITLLEEEVIPAIQQCLKRVDELDERLLAQQELLHRCQLEAEREALGALRLQMA